VRIITIHNKPYTVINGKDFAVYRWFEPSRHGPVFLQVAGRTALSREDLPTDDWIVLSGRDHGHRIATAWRKPWFDYKLDAVRKLAFVGGSTEGSFYLALRYLVRRFGLIASPADLATWSGELAQRAALPYAHVIDRSVDSGLTDTRLVTLDIPAHWERDDGTRFLDAVANGAAA
jgi:hypothetical protein